MGRNTRKKPQSTSAKTQPGSKNSPNTSIPLSSAEPNKQNLNFVSPTETSFPASGSSKVRAAGPLNHPPSAAENGELVDENIAPPISTDSEQQAEIKKEQGNTQFKLQNYTQAVALYTEAIKLNPQNPAYIANRAAALMSLKSYVSALSDMQLATSFKFSGHVARTSPKNLLRLARCYLALGQLYQARQTLSDLLKDNPEFSEGIKELARLTRVELTVTRLQKNHDREDWSMVLIGLDTLQRELDLGSLTAKEWIVWRVEALCGKKKWDDAKSLSNELVRSHPSDPEALYCRAWLMYSQGNLAATVAHCQEAMRCDPDFVKARKLLRQSRLIETAKEAGNAAFKASNFEIAIEKYVHAASIDPSNQSITLTLNSNRAQALLKSHQYADAIDVCNRILKIDSKHFKALRTRARAKKGESDFQAAIADLQSAIPLAPSDKDKTELMTEIRSTKAMLAKSKYVDHYKVLGVSRGASDDEIKKAFRKQSLIHHPDKGGNEEKFKEVNESYTVLQDPQSRRRFDMVDPEDPDGLMGQCHNGFGHDDGDGMEMPVNMADLFTSASFGASGGSGFRTSSSRGFGQSQNGFSSPFFTHSGGF